MRNIMIGALGVAAAFLAASAVPASADGLFAGIGASPHGFFAGVGIGATGYADGYEAVPGRYIPPSAVRYNRPCSVSDGFRTVAVSCAAAAAVTSGVAYVPAGTAYGYHTYYRSGWRRFHHRRHHHVIRRKY